MKRFLLGLFISFAFLLTSTGPLNAQPNGTYDRAIYLYKKGNFKGAVDQLKKYLKRRPEPSAYYLMGYALYELGKYEEAVKYFNEAYLLDPDFRPEKIDFSRAKP